MKNYNNSRGRTAFRRKSTTQSWHRAASALLCFVMLFSTMAAAFATDSAVPSSPVEEAQPLDATPSPEVTEIPADATPSPEVTEAPADATPSPEVTEAPADVTPTPEVTETPVDAASAPEETEQLGEDLEAAVYTLHLTHVFRFTLEGKKVSVQASEDISLTEADFVDGLCDISRFAYGAEQLTVTRANPLPISSFTAARQGGAQILYALAPGWRVVRSGAAEADSIVLRDVFQGNLDDYEFVPVNVVSVRVNYKYSNTGSLAGVNAFDSEIVEAVPEKQADGTYKLTWDMSDKAKEGFRLVLDPTELNKYVVSPPTGNETPEQLKQKLENGDFNVNVNDPTKPVYYYQEAGVKVGTNHPVYGNIYSTQYNEAWNAARKLNTAACTAEAMSADVGHSYGASQIQNPKIEIILTEEQRSAAQTNGLDLTIFYRRNATWYTVKHWVQHDYSSYSDQPFDTLTATEKETVDGVNYVLQNTEQVQGRVGALTNAKVRTDGIYRYVSPVSFSQKEIAEKDTVVEIFYKIPAVYTVIFDTNYTYIPRQQVKSEENVDFSIITSIPQRTGYKFGGWQYLKDSAVANADGSYNDTDYIAVEELSDGSYSLQLSRTVVENAKLVDTGGTLALYLYPKWVSDTTQVRVILWTEDLTGTDDVQAIAEGGNPEFYNQKYAGYSAEPVTHKPQHDTSDAYYSNAGSFVIENLISDSSLLNSDGTLLDGIKTRVDTEFKNRMGDVNGVTVADFYELAAFEIVHEEEDSITWDATTASGDGKTTIYVYFTRNIYTLKFHFYGEQGGSAYSVATKTNGYSYGNIEDFLNGEEFIFDASTSSSFGSNSFGKTTATNDSQMPVPKMITVKAKYGADLRDVWPGARPDEEINLLDGTLAKLVSWTATMGKYRDDANNTASAHYHEATIMGVYASMGSEIVAAPANPETIHHLVAFWAARSDGGISYYRYNHCYEVPDLNVDGMTKVSIYGNDTQNESNFLYLVPIDNNNIAKYSFNDLMRVSYDASGMLTYDDENGTYYAVRGYNDKYYALARQVIAPSTNSIGSQNPSARLHMTRVNPNADHSTQYQDNQGGWENRPWFSDRNNPYDLYFYYNRDHYTITYMASSNNSSTAAEVTLGTIELPYGAEVTKDTYGPKLNYTDKNTNSIYPWTASTPEVPVCPDRSENGTAEWTFKGWALGPAGVNMQWTYDEAGTAQHSDGFPISSNLRLYAIWETPSYTVTFHLNGGNVDGNTADIEELIPANTRYSVNGVIPRPHKENYVLKGWFNADENGDVTSPETAFDFDQNIAADKHVAAVWAPVTTERFSYTIWYVTQNPFEADKNKPTETLGGVSYTVLDSDKHTDEMYTANMVVNLTAVPQEGYVPEKVFDTFTPEASKSYDIIFAYNPVTARSHTVRFIEAGTETGQTPRVIHYYEVTADRTVTTPDATELAKVIGAGYRLVNKEAGGSYTPVTDADALTWLDGTDLAAAKPNAKTTLVGDAIPGEIVYLVQPIAYKISYANAAGSPAEAKSALDAVTAAAGTMAGSSGDKNPTLYADGNKFTLKNPASFIANDKLYTFSHWMLAPGTTLADTSSKQTEFPTLDVTEGTKGDIGFIANWAAVNIYDLTITKHVEGNAGEPDREFSFTITLRDGNNQPVSGTYGNMTFNNGTATFTLTHNQSLTATGIPENYNYTVTEAAADGYTTTVTGDVQGTFNANKSVTFTNTRALTPGTGSLVVSKAVAGDAGETTRYFHFTVELDDKTVNTTFGDFAFTNGVANITLHHGESKTAIGLPNGVGYTVAEAEANTDGYTTTSVNASGSIVGNEVTNVSFTNSRSVTPPAPGTGSLTISKTVTGIWGERSRSFLFKVTLYDAADNAVAESVDGQFGQMAFTKGTALFTLKHGESITASGLPAGLRYTVEERDDSGYITTAYGNTGTITDSRTVTASFVNYKGTQPRTGDDASLALLLTLMGASLFVLTALPAAYVRKTKKRARR